MAIIFSEMIEYHHALDARPRDLYFESSERFDMGLLEQEKGCTVALPRQVKVKLKELVQKDATV